MIEVCLLNSAIVERIDALLDGQQPVEVFEQTMKDDSPFDGIARGSNEFDEVLTVLSPQRFAGGITLDQRVRRWIIEYDAAQVFAHQTFERVLGL